MDVYDCTVEENNDSLFLSILTAYDIVGISLYSLNITSSYDFVNKVAAFLKNHADKKIPVVLGGPHVTVAGKDALTRTDADFAIKGEGELTLSELLKNFQHRDRLDQIAGLIWKDELKTVVENSSRGFIEDIDTLPLPDYSVFKLDRYISYELNEIPINTSRGCPFDCIFCAAHLVGGKRFRARNPENVVQEMVVHYKNGMHNFYIVDDAFNLNIKRAEEICDLIIKNGLDIKFVFQNGLLGHPAETYDKAMDSIRLAREIVKKKLRYRYVF